VSLVIRRISESVTEADRVRLENAFGPDPDLGSRHDIGRRLELSDGRVLSIRRLALSDDSGDSDGDLWIFRDDTHLAALEAETAELRERLASAQQSQFFLLRAMRSLAGASGYEETVELLADVSTPVLGDLFVIDILDERDRIVRIISRHADTALQPAADRLISEFPPEPDSGEPSIEVIRTGRSSWAHEISDELLRAWTRSEAHFQLVKQLNFASYICVPLFLDESVIGAVTLVSAGSGRRYQPEELALVEVLADPIAQVVSRGRRYDEQRGIAQILQTSLLPASLPEIPGITVAARYVPGTRGAEVGGDFYDVMLTPTGAVGMMVGDVAGHDPAAAAAMGQLRAASRALAGQVRTPAELVDLMSSSWDLIGIDLMATVAYGRLNSTSGHLQLASAGHPPPIYVSHGRAEVLRFEPAPPLGVGGPPLPIPMAASDPRRSDPGHGPPPRTAEWSGTMSPGDLLLLYTDGLVERRDRPIEDGIALLAEAAAAKWHGNPGDLCDHLISQLTEGQELSDDVALLAIGFEGPPA
jgi:hypothetical protein